MSLPNFEVNPSAGSEVRVKKVNFGQKLGQSEIGVFCLVAAGDSLLKHVDSYQASFCQNISSIWGKNAEFSYQVR